ncbi:hypothetical protein CWE06_11580 [Aliidiomarina haloalkalitolerans]|uniref:Uncharacterized protein n=1 Tax=Aliidiomarina haloalkalitolerans TaxID=859059 RepID=A0A432VQ36_9GAMM|nr:hypothetical protein CWE06_11580 [Aliidiomarina haloalkalitolerans]
MEHDAPQRSWGWGTAESLKRLPSVGFSCQLEAAARAGFRDGRVYEAWMPNISPQGWVHGVSDIPEPSPGEPSAEREQSPTLGKLAKSQSHTPAPQASKAQTLSP